MYTWSSITHSCQHDCELIIQTKFMQQHLRQQAAPQNAVCHMHATQQLPAVQQREVLTAVLHHVFMGYNDKLKQRTATPGPMASML
jgi:hypothetical protein